MLVGDGRFLAEGLHGVDDFRMNLRDVRQLVPWQHMGLDVHVGDLVQLFARREHLVLI